MPKPYKPKIKSKTWPKKHHKVKQLQKHSHSRPLAKGPKKWSNQQSLKLASVFLFASLMAIILIVPTLIVIPFMDSGPPQTTADEQTEPIQLLDGDSHLSVSVMRNQSKEIEEIPLEQYVAGVVSAEMPAEFEVEALKAQALAARTYIVNHLLHQTNEENANITDTVDHQVYKSDTELRERWGKDYNWKMRRIQEAVAATKGEVLTYDDVTITPAFFSTSNGYTENSEDYWENELPYLRSVASPWDKASPKFLDQKIFTLQEVESALGITIPNDGSMQMTITRTESGRVETLNLGAVDFSGRTIREKLGLRSSDFSIKQKNNHFIFTTKGYGHGIGMSQYGANGMAKEGKSYRDIIQYYYKGVDINLLSETAPTLVMSDQERSKQ
ncbi:stage II sporulation protein D [Lentibacillus saliphilus]|uniref:stage II sporulation protein D n=1 Tax=Lentibacillus saliphilus TaxID=2737028 RepID=UPI001C2FCFD9|nr:stage II sporulation protein D [Lentibacillus saliphilus]